MFQQVSAENLMIDYLKLWSDLYMKKQKKKKKHPSLKVQRYWVGRQQYTEPCLTWQEGTHRFSRDKCVSHAI